MARHDGRRAGELRGVEIVRGYTRFAPGSVLIRWGDTHVLCTACWSEGVPRWKAGRGSGWVTAEYDMLPGSTDQRRNRNRFRVDGRTQEIQRLIGRTLRAVVDLELLGENSVLIDCDVLQADGGTRTASITGAYVALCDAVRHAIRAKRIRKSPVLDSVAAVSVGRVSGRLLLDLDYAEDSAAEVDLNVAMTGSGACTEVQGTGEGATFTRQELDRMMRLAARGIRELQALQAKALRRRLPVEAAARR
ncbi:MAG: ribonuclease PH [Planctomycetota bacterium]|jgi:ribonuclease PH